MNSSLQPSLGTPNSSQPTTDIQITYRPETVYLKFIESTINEAISKKQAVIFLSTSAQMQQDFKKYCYINNLTKILSDKQLDIKMIIESLWQRVQKAQYSQLAKDCTEKMNQPQSGYSISLAQAQSIMNEMKINEMTLNIVNFANRATKYLAEHPNQSVHEYMKKCLKSESGLPKGAFYESIPAWRKEYKIPETSIISAICQKHLVNKDKTIEIGAGKLENGLSYLTERMPPHLSASVELTEVHNYFRKSIIGYKRVDLCKMDESYQPSSVDKIIGSSVLDVLSKADLSIAFEQIHATLKPGGKLIHFAHMEPFENTLVSSFSEDTFVCFPWEDEEGFKGLLRVRKDKLMNFISKNENLSTFVCGFLNWYSNLTAGERELTINLITSERETSREFSKWIKEINPDGLENIDNMEFFKERMRSGLESANFEIQKFGYRWHNHIRDRCESDAKEHNYFSWALGQKTATTIYVLLKRYVCHAVKMHVIVAKKKEG